MMKEKNNFSFLVSIKKNYLEKITFKLNIIIKLSNALVMILFIKLKSHLFIKIHYQNFGLKYF